MDCYLISSSFFDDIPEEDELPLHFEIPGPIPDLIDLYSYKPETRNNNNNNKPPSSSDAHEDDGELLVGFTIPGPIPDLLDLYNQKPNNFYRRPRVQNTNACYNNPTTTLEKLETSNSKPRVRATVSQESTKTVEKLETYKTRSRKRSIKTRERIISKEKQIINEVCEDVPKFFPKRGRSKIARTCRKISGKKKPWANAILILLG